MTEDQEPKDGQQDVAGKMPFSKAKDRKPRNKPLTKILLRRLPPSMTEQDFLEQVSPIPDHDYFYFTKPDTSLGQSGFCRAYINFVNVEDIYLFKDKFDGYIFLDDRGVEHVCIVEYAPFQRIPKRRKKRDPKCGSIESDPIYQEFLESLKEPENENREPKLEYSYQVNDVQDKKMRSTPLLDYLAARKQDKKAREERRRRETDKRKIRIDRKTKEGPIKEEEISPDTEVKKIKSREWEKDKTMSKKKEDDFKSNDSKDSKYNLNKTNIKSYREQRKLVDEQRKRSDNDKRDTRYKETNNFETEKSFRKERREKVPSPKDPKAKEIKKYSDTRKDRIKFNEKKEGAIGEIDKRDDTVSDPKMIDKVLDMKVSKSLSHSEIKPFTQLPQIKTDDLTKVIEEMDRKMKLDEQANDAKSPKEIKSSDISTSPAADKPIVEDGAIKKSNKIVLNNRRNSLESGVSVKDEYQLKRQNSLEGRGKSTDREDSMEKDGMDGGSVPRTERRIRNKDRPSLVIYQPGMGRFSKQRISKDKESPQAAGGKPVTEIAEKDT